MNYVNRNWLPLYVWWVITTLLSVGLFWAGYNGVYEIVYNSDVTHLTQVIAVATIIGILRIGWMSYQWSKEWYTNEWRHDWIQNDNLIARIKKHVSEWNYLSSMFVIIGLIGTLIGFSIIFYTITPIIEASGITPSTIIEVLPKMLDHMGTIFYPTVFGLISMTIIKIQLLLFKSFSGIEDEKYGRR